MMPIDEPEGELWGLRAREQSSARRYESGFEGVSPSLREVLDRTTGLSPLALAEALVADQAVRWERGERVPAEHYLQLSSILDGELEAASDVVYGEFLLREQQGESPALDEFLGRFPKLADQLIQLHKATRFDDILTWLGLDMPYMSENGVPPGDPNGLRADQASHLGLVDSRYRVIRPHSKGGAGRNLRRG